MLEFRNIKTFLLKNTLQISLKKFLLLFKLKTQFHGHMISDSKGEPIYSSFYEKNCKKLVKKNLE